MTDRIVLVEWTDTISSHSSHGWQAEDEFPVLSRIVSVGYLVAEDEESYTMVDALDQRTPDPRETTVKKFGCAHVIPKATVTSLTDLVPKRRKADAADTV